MTKIDFGFRQVDVKQKEKLVEQVFTSVADQYDIMNDIMSFGMHYLWKKRLIQELYPYTSNNLLDVASGTLDIAKDFLIKGGASVTAVDINAAMLERGRRKLLDIGFISPALHVVCANAEQLPFADECFDYYTISFGIRNVTNKDRALREAHRVLKPGGKIICLEFSNVDNATIRKLYEFYSFNIIPKIGRVIADDAASYQYLVESIQKFPSACKFANMIENAGFDNVSYQKLTFGIVALHIGYKI